ncbi:mechanosensitive ion channel family protein [Agrobacterium sp. S2]|nr:mechanosensitive ion channel family protein [Agrobacterium sp. S2]
MRWWIALVLGLFLCGAAEAQTDVSAQQKVDQLVDLLQDPDVQSLLRSNDRTRSQPKEPSVSGHGIAAWETRLRAHIDEIAKAVPRIPSDIAAAALRTRADAISHGYAPVFIIFGGLLAVGLVAEWLYRSRRQATDGVMARFAPIAIFAVTMAIIFFAIEWPPLARIVLLVYLTAFVIYRLAAVLVDVAAGARLRGRAKLLLGAIIFGVAGAFVGPSIGIPTSTTQAISYLLSVFVLLCAVEAIWSAFGFSRVGKTVRSGALLVIWIFWSLHLMSLFWLGVYILVLPGLLRAAGTIAAAASARSSSSLKGILVVRGVRAVVVGLAIGWLALVWKMNPDGLGHDNATVTSVFYGLLKSVVVLLLADLIWQLAKEWIDRKLSESSNLAGLPAVDAARRARFRTLLPIFRNALAVVVIVVTALMVLAELGVEIGPLIAGAGIFGVALGFGSQTLVKDVISGVFYMLDDAFRVGEYIQAKNYKGTVEGFSLRSVRLRHHRGPVYTVPFGELGAVENMSRDWGVVKFRISVGYDTDIEKARKLTKKIGASLMEDPELGPLFIEPLKMKGLEEFGDYGLVLSFGMTLKPSPMQSFIRRRANLLLREVFTANGIEFATPSVQVGSGDNGAAEAAAAISAVRAQEAKNASSAPS